ncbi:MAG: hypothetical protein ABI165_08665, partial [Bryobacteraceae bacterium]
GHEQRIERLACRFHNGAAIVSLHGRSDTGLEQWAAERAGVAFRQVYNVPLGLVKAARHSAAKPVQPARR